MADGQNFEWPDEVVDYFHTLTGGWGEDGVLDYFKTFVDEALAAAWERGFAEGEKHERNQ